MSIEQIVLRLVLSVLIGGLIGMERGRHGRAAGMRTHILVCLGATMTALTGIYVDRVLGGVGDVTRLSAQVISGVGFLGAGMIILKNGNVVTGLTTAAGVWTTATIGISLGYGFYLGAGVAAALFLITTLLLAKLERVKRRNEQIYLEIEDPHKLNETMDDIKELITVTPDYTILPPKSGTAGNVGVHLSLDKRYAIEPAALKHIKNVVFAVEE